MRQKLHCHFCLFSKSEKKGDIIANMNESDRGRWGEAVRVGMTAETLRALWWLEVGLWGGGGGRNLTINCSSPLYIYQPLIRKLGIFRIIGIIRACCLPSGDNQTPTRAFLPHGSVAAQDWLWVFRARRWNPDNICLTSVRHNEYWCNRLLHRMFLVSMLLPGSEAEMLSNRQKGIFPKYVQRSDMGSCSQLKCTEQRWAPSE